MTKLYYYAQALASGGAAWLLVKIIGHAAAHALGLPHPEVLP